MAKEIDIKWLTLPIYWLRIKISNTLAKTNPNELNKSEYKAKHKTVKPTFFNIDRVKLGQLLLIKEFLSFIKV